MTRPRTFSLTSRQDDCLAAIKRHMASTGRAPSRRELQHALGLRSPGHVVQLLRALQERGWIEVLPNKVRAIAVVAEEAAPGGYQLSPTVQDALRAYCIKHNEGDPSAVVNDAVALFLDEVEGSIAA